MLLMATVVLEIGTEEIPASYLAPALAQLDALARTQLQATRIAYEDIHTWCTPRRLTLFVTGVAEQQAAAVREVRGPAVRDAFATNGEPTQAALGFARSLGVPVNELRIRQIDDGEYLVAIFRDEGQPTADLLPDIFLRLITSLTFPKTMRWASGPFRFARPIRWIVALMDDRIVPVTIDRVTSNRLTRGHRFLAPGEVEVPVAAEYTRLMDESQVVVDQDARREMIRQQLIAIAQQENATILDDGSLLEETTFRTEYPTAVRGALDPAALELPREVLLQVLRREQNFFPLASPDDELLPTFIAVRNGDKAYLSTVREGYEGVARAKLLDARFFYEHDRQQPLADRVDALRGVIYQERLGTLYDKTKRVETLAGLIAAWLSLSPEDRQAAERAAYLAKADLVTAMVTEHPELQGIMGGVYARLSGEPEVVSTAIGAQYQPRTAGAAIPATTIGQVLALADKLDTVVACFAIGLAPTSSEDPYALRREAFGILRILVEAGYPLQLSQLITRALRLIDIELAQPRDVLQQALAAFFRQRLETVLAGNGIATPVSRAVLDTHADTPARASRLADFLTAHLDTPTLHEVTRVATRLANITKHYPGDHLRDELLTEPAERALYQRYTEITPQIETLTQQGDYTALLALLGSLVPEVDHFFSDILVMAEDTDLRQARLALTWHVAMLFRHLGNLSLLGL